MIILSRHSKNSLKLYGITIDDIKNAIENPDVESFEKGKHISIKMIEGKFNNKPLKIVYTIENGDYYLITAYPVKRINIKGRNR